MSAARVNEKILSNVTAPAAGANGKKIGLAGTDELVLQITGTHTGLSITVHESYNGIDFVQVGAALTTNGITRFTGKRTNFRVDVDAITTNFVDVWAYAA